MNIITSRLKFSICLVLLMTIKSIGADASTITVKDVEGNLELNNTIIVTVDGLTSYIENSEKDPNKFILYLNWRPIKGLYPSYIPESGGQGKLRFDVDHTTDSENEWKALLGRPISKGWSYEVNVSIGYENEKPIPSDKLLPLVIIRKSWFYFFCFTFLIVLVLFFLGVKNTNIIRVPPKKDLREDQSKRPYSLGKAQMAFWFFIVLGSYLFIWMVIGNYESMPDTALALMGISASTALGAVGVTSHKRSDTENKCNALKRKKASLEAEKDELDRKKDQISDPQDMASLRAKIAEIHENLEQVESKLNELKRTTSPLQTKGFFNDILKDADGITLHRFQQLVWTLVLGIIFLKSVYDNLAMPEFSGTLLALMGISNGAYIGFKFPEGKN